MIFKPGDTAMIVRTCGCVHYVWCLGEVFRVGSLEELSLFCSYQGPMGTNPHYQTMMRRQTLLVLEKPTFMIRHAPAAWCIKLDPLAANFNGEVERIRKSLLKNPNQEVFA